MLDQFSLRSRSQTIIDFYTLCKRKGQINVYMTMVNHKQTPIRSRHFLRIPWMRLTFFLLLQKKNLNLAMQCFAFSSSGQFYWYVFTFSPPCLHDELPLLCCMVREDKGIKQQYLGLYFLHIPFGWMLSVCDLIQAKNLNLVMLSFRILSSGG